MIQELETALNGRLGKKEIHIIIEWASLSPDNRDRLLSLALSNQEKISSNALWCMTHLRKKDASWLQSNQKLFIDSLLEEKQIAKIRMLLQLLRDQDYPEESIRVDFLDFCLSKINSECDPYAIRCFSLYISIKMCRYFPELLCELKERISMLSREPLSPGMKCAVRKVTQEIQSLSKS